MFQLNKAAHVLSHVLEPDMCLGADDPDTPHQYSAHIVALSPEYMLHPNTGLCAGFIALLLPSAQRLVPVSLIMDTARHTISFSIVSISADR